MPTVKPVSDLRNYDELLLNVAIGSPVFLTNNGQGQYAVLHMDEYKEYEKLRAWRRLSDALDSGYRSGEEKGWIPAEEVKAHFVRRYNG